MRAGRYFDSFPKVGIVVPNPVAWLLPEFIEIGNTISTTLELPKGGNGAPFGARISPTSDGFLVWLPAGTHPADIIDTLKLLLKSMTSRLTA